MGKTNTVTRTDFPLFSSKFLIFELSIFFFAGFVMVQAEEQPLEVPTQTLVTEVPVTPQVTGTPTPSEEATEPIVPTTESPEPVPLTDIPPSESTPSVETLPIEPSPVVTPEVTQSPQIGEPLEATEPPVESVEETILPTEDYSSDYTFYKQYLLFQKYEQYMLYKQYEQYAGVAWRGQYFENKKAEKKYLKALKKKYDKYRKKPSKYTRYAPQAKEYTSYGNDKNTYFATKPYAGYGHLLRFNRPEFEAYKEYGSELHKAGYERYKKALEEGKVTDTGDADLDASELGPSIPVGIFNFVPSDLRESAFKIKADGNWKVLHRNGETLATIAADKSIRVKYTGDKRFRVYDPDTDVTLADTSKEVRFEADSINTIFDVNRPNSSFDRYRGDIKLRYYDSPESDGDRVWVINTIPLEHYVWGMGEITGTGPDEYDKLMTTIFRTYGYWKIKWSTKYADQGFKVDATAGNQVYLGYDWEVTHPDIRKGAEATRGTLVMYEREVALTPYSSWTDGNTRRFEDGHWGRLCKTETGKTSTLYPWLSATSDDRGKHESESACSLASKGNHMVGVSANGAVRMAKYDNATWDAMLEHYYPGVDLIVGY
jgi:hypothetical protein